MTPEEKEQYQSEFWNFILAAILTFGIVGFCITVGHELNIKQCIKEQKND